MQFAKSMELKKKQILNQLKAAIYDRYENPHNFSLAINEDVQNLYKALNGQRAIKLESLIYYLKKCNVDVTISLKPMKKKKIEINF